jgi:hypothetical protein
MLNLKEHDPSLFSDTGTRFTTNCSSLLAYVRDKRKEICTSLNQGTPRPGAIANTAIQEFLSDITSWLSPLPHTEAGLLLEALTYEKSSFAASIAQDLVCVAVDALSYSKNYLEEVITTISTTGCYDRSLCDYASLTTKTGYAKFCPSSVEGKHSWVLLQRLLVAYFARPLNTVKDIAEAKAEYENLEQKGLTVREFLAKDNTNFRGFVNAGGQMPDQARIISIRERCSSILLSELKNYTKMQAFRGEYDPNIDLRFASFATVLDRVGQSLDLCGHNELNQEPLPENPEKPANMYALSGPRNSNACWNHSVGTCKFGTGCRWEHLGDEGAERHTVADENDNCLKGATCYRKNCPFNHPDKEEKETTNDPPASVPKDKTVKHVRMFQMLERRHATKY